MREREFARVDDRVVAFPESTSSSGSGIRRGASRPTSGRCDRLLQALAGSAPADCRRGPRAWRFRAAACREAWRRSRDRPRAAGCGVGLRRDAEAAPFGGVAVNCAAAMSARPEASAACMARSLATGYMESVTPSCAAKARGQLEFEALGALRPQVVAGRQVQRDDPQLVAGADLLERRRRRLCSSPAVPPQRSVRQTAPPAARRSDRGLRAPLGIFCKPPLTSPASARIPPPENGADCRWQTAERIVPPERYRSGHNGADSKSDGRVIPARGFESHPLRHWSDIAACERSLAKARICAACRGWRVGNTTAVQRSVPSGARDE